MSTKNIWIAVIVAVVVIFVAWLSLDHRYAQPLPPDLQPPAATITPATASSTAASAVSTASAANTTNQSSVKNFMHTVTIKTNMGTILFETYDADAPNTVANFIKLADAGFYNGLIFHRLIQGFMIQGGDPLTKDPAKQAQWGTGGPGYQFADELNPNTPSYKTGYVRGTVAMANSGPNTNGSQFFIMQKDTPLPHSYTIFGKVISGMNVVDAIASVPTNGNPPAGSNRPLSPVTMTSVTVATTSAQ